jgi:hypothetical protein
MADYFTQFSCWLEVGTSANVERALAIYKEMATALEAAEGITPGFDVLVDSTTVGGLLILDADGYGEPEHVIAFVLRCAEAFDLRGRWGFRWALTCSKPRLDGFGGGAQLLDLGARKSLDWIDCDHWLTARTWGSGAGPAD